MTYLKLKGGHSMIFQNSLQRFFFHNLAIQILKRSFNDFPK